MNSLQQAMLTFFKAGFWIVCKGDGKPLESFKEECDAIEFHLYKPHSVC